MRIVKPEETTITSLMAQQTCLHSNRYGTEKLLEVAFSMQSTTRLHIRAICQKKEVSVRVKQRPVKMGGRTTYRTLSPKRAPFQIGID
jgi:hypothetical protein